MLKQLAFSAELRLEQLSLRELSPDLYGKLRVSKGQRSADRRERLPASSDSSLPRHQPAAFTCPPGLRSSRRQLQPVGTMTPTTGFHLRLPSRTAGAFTTPTDAQHVKITEHGTKEPSEFRNGSCTPTSEVARSQPSPDSTAASDGTPSDVVSSAWDASPEGTPSADGPFGCCGKFGMTP